MIKDLLIYITYWGMLIFISCAFSVMVTMFVGLFFESIIKTPKLRGIKPIATDDLKDKEREYALKRLLAESRMGSWWQIALLIFIAGVTLFVMHKGI